MLNRIKPESLGLIKERMIAIFSIYFENDGSIMPEWMDCGTWGITLFVDSIRANSSEYLHSVVCSN
jgi:hypothetical protein